MKQLKINFSGKSDFDKRIIHDSVQFLKNELDFNITELIINFVNEKEITSINSEYLNHNYSTDIITFNYSETKLNLDGEIYISLEEARKNAERFGSLPGEEIIRLVTHGILHLLGFNDESKSEKSIMKKIENKLVLKQKNIWGE